MSRWFPLTGFPFCGDVLYYRTYEKAVSGGGEGKGRTCATVKDTTSRGLFVRVRPPHTSERRGGGGGCEQGGWRGAHVPFFQCRQYWAVAKISRRPAPCPAPKPFRRWRRSLTHRTSASFPARSRRPRCLAGWTPMPVLTYSAVSICTRMHTYTYTHTHTHTRLYSHIALSAYVL